MRDDGSSRQTYGVCHRCGWKGNVGKVHRRDRKEMGCGRAYGRLCNDCVSDLRRGGPDLRQPSGARPAKTRRVA